MVDTYIEGYAALVGDISGSKLSVSRSLLQTVTEGALVQTNEHIGAVQPLQTTFGDEFQGLYSSLQSALQATFWIRLRLRAVAGDALFGVGWGPLTEMRGPMVQDGPAWWAARSAVETATTHSRRSEGPRGLRTWFVSFAKLAEAASISDRVRWERETWRPIDDELIGAPPGRLRPGLDELINAYLLCRDQMVEGLRPQEIPSLMDFFGGKRQVDIARAEGVSQSAISQRFMRNGTYALAMAEEQLQRALA